MEPSPSPPLRKFVFLNLPTELRLQIYSHLLIGHHPTPTTTKPPTTTSTLSNLSGPGRISFCDVTGTPYTTHRPSLALLATSRQLHAEASQYFYEHHAFEVSTTPLDIFSPSSSAARNGTDADNTIPSSFLLPSETHFRLQSLRHLRVVIRLDSLHAGSYFPISVALARLPALRSLRIAFVFAVRLYMRQDNAGLWARSAALQGLVLQIVGAVPSEVEVGWGVWEDLEAQVRSDGRGWRNWGFVDGKVVEEIAERFEGLRGGLVGRR